MKRVLVLLACVAAGISITGLSTAGPTAAATTHRAGTHRIPVQVTSLRKARPASLGPTTDGPISGVFYSQDSEPPQLPGRGGNNCLEPYCPLTYEGGSVQRNPHVYLLLWGPGWENDSDPDQEAAATYLQNFYEGLGVTPQDNWSTILTQYNQGGGPPEFGSGVLAGVWEDMTAPPPAPTQDEIAAEADSWTMMMGVTDLSDAQIVVATQSGTCPPGFPGSGCSPPPSGSNTYCAWHSYSNEPYTNLPYMPDAGPACGEDSANPDGTYDGFSIAGGHEFADTVTDPIPQSGYFDPNEMDSTPPGWEVADKCAWGPGSKDVALSTGSFAMQGLWSNAYQGIHDGCELPAGNQSDIVSVTDPDDQTTYQEAKLTLMLSGGSSGANPLTWSATGLPPGLAIGTSSGVISGQIKAAAHTYTVLVTASDQTGAIGWTSFSWQVKADVGTTITNRAGGLCLNDKNYQITAGSTVFLWPCDKDANERWSHPTNTGEVIVLGQCLTASGKGGVGAFVHLEACTGAPSQEWNHTSTGEYEVEKSMKCLTDPNGSTQETTQPLLEDCTNAKDERWTGS